jgi:hypothetical protein
MRGHKSKGLTDDTFDSMPYFLKNYHFCSALHYFHKYHINTKPPIQKLYFELKYCTIQLLLTNLGRSTNHYTKFEFSRPSGSFSRPAPSLGSLQRLAI